MGNDEIEPYDITKVKTSELLDQVLDEMERILKPHGLIDDVRMQMVEFETELKRRYQAALKEEKKKR